MNLTKKLVENLRKMYSESGNERGGYVTSSGYVFEVENIHPSPENNFMFSCEDLEKLEKDDIIATFHTHPNKPSNLSKEDYDSFVNWEKLLHFIIGNDKISCYKVSERGTVIVEPITEIEDVC